jgi:predicted DNA-binding transcriptional regulator AlpA
MQQNPQAVDAFLRLPQVLALIPISRSGWWAGVKDGRFPQPIKLSPRVTVWKASDLQAYIDGVTK